ncbi:MAG TPA: hypothetical protein VGG36_01900 [Rhizomicrobium sp.]|jgi:hypothetical protein
MLTKLATAAAAILLLTGASSANPAAESYPIMYSGSTWSAVPFHLSDGEAVKVIPSNREGASEDAAIAVAKIYVSQHEPQCAYDKTSADDFGGWKIRLKCPPKAPN